MFLRYQHLIFVWLLLQFADCNEETNEETDKETTHKHLFPSVPLNVTEETFPLIYKTTSLSDFIFVKSPGKKYKHTKKKDAFYLDDELYENDLLEYTDNKAFFWTPMIYNSSKPNLFHSGSLNIMVALPSSFMSYEWSFNLTWEKKPNPIEIAEPYKITSKLPSPTNKCNVNESRLLLYYKDKNNILTKLNFNNTVVAGHVNDLYYYFEKPDNEDKREIKEPCTIIRAINDEPEVLFRGNISSPFNYNGLTIHIIKDELISGLYSVHLFLKNTSTPDFYYKEEIVVRKMRYRRNGVEDIPNSDYVSDDILELKGFQIIKVIYNCPTQNGIKQKAGIFYLAPLSDSYVFPNMPTVYLANETTTQPNCSLNRISFGYLESMTYNGITTNLNELTNNGPPKNYFKRVDDFVFLVDVNKNNVTLNCFYITLNGNITLVLSYLRGKKVYTGLNEKGEEVYEMRVRTDQTDEYERMIAEQDKLLAQHKKSSFEKLKDKIGASTAYALVIVISLILIIIIFIIAFFCSKKLLIPWIGRKKIQMKYPKIYAFWNEISKQKMEVYYELIKDKKYIPDKLQNQNGFKKIEGGEVVDTNTNSLFDDSLVSCFKSINGEIKAHYIKDVSPIRTYIISDGPTNEKVDYFWELLYREDVGMVVAVINDQNDDNKNENGNMFYWPEKKQKYGKINVEFCESPRPSVPTILVRKFIMTIDNKEPKNLALIHIDTWKEHDIPRIDVFFINLYNEISKNAGTNKVLIHSSHGPGSRVFMITYFCCIFEAMMENIIDDPLEVIKQVRTQRYGGNISSLEFAYIIRALATFFFDRKMLADEKEYKWTFYEQYDHFMLKIDDRKLYMDPSLKNFLTFVNVIDGGKLKDICDQFLNIKMPTEAELHQKCKRFYAVASLKDMAMKKIRFMDVPCYDKSSIIIRGRESNDLNGFIHANEFIYNFGIGNERKIIMCQGPLKETIDDMFDMIHRKKIAVVVVLVNKEEFEKGEKCFSYFYTGKEELPFGTYNLLYKGHNINTNNFFIEYNYSVVNSASKVAHNFKILHYLNWPDKTIPNENQSLHGLYRRITELNNGGHIAIYCTNGVGRTGTLALIIYMIDIINSRQPFDPIKCLAKIRQHRYKAVQTTGQFIFALSILYEHFKEQIGDMDKNAYRYFMSLAQNIYNENANNVLRKWQ
uniref:Protein-tyrosine-phosphatase n=1 Tax=Strongyloides stercoralis TaxID=6248 RepID=A0A913HNI6_STRER